MTFTQVLQWLLRNPEILVGAIVIGGPVISAISKRIRENARQRADAIRRERERLEELRTGRPVSSVGGAPILAPPDASAGGSGAPGENPQPTMLVRLPGGIVLEVPTPPNPGGPGTPGTSGTSKPQRRPKTPAAARTPAPQQRRTQGVTGPFGTANPSPGNRGVAQPPPMSGRQLGTSGGAPSGISQGGMIAQQQRTAASGERDARQRQIDSVVASQAKDARREENAKKRAELAAREKERLEREREDKAAMAAAFANPTERATDAQSKRATQAGASLGVAKRASGVGVGAIMSHMSRDELRRAMVMQELLGPPASLRENAGTWQPPG